MLLYFDDKKMHCILKHYHFYYCKFRTRWRCHQEHASDWKTMAGVTSEGVNANEVTEMLSDCCHKNHKATFQREKRHHTKQCVLVDQPTAFWSYCPIWHHILLNSTLWAFVFPP